MAEERPGGEAKEAPTAKRLDDARKKGDRLTARELGAALSGVAGTIWLLAFAAPLASSLQRIAAAAFATPADGPGADLGRWLIGTLGALLWPMGALLAMVLVAAIMGQTLTGGIGVSLEPLKPQFGKLNPLKGLKRIFGTKGLVELVKALAKAGLLLGGAAMMLLGAVPVLVGLSATDLPSALQTLVSLAGKLLMLLSAGLVLIAAIDLPWQWWQWRKKLRMNRQELRDEHKQSEGSPELKGAMRRAARAMLKSGNRAAMAEATVVLTNPTHFAVALRYRPDQDAAPVLLRRGRGLMAEVIRELAKEEGVMILSYPSVARALYFTGREGMMIRPDLYGAVAVILAFVLRAGAELGQTPPEAEAPEGARFDELGRAVD